MNILNEHDDLPIGFIGDIHGDFGAIKDKVKYYQLENVILFQAGDFGVGFRYNNPREPRKEHKRLMDLNDFLKKRNIFIYVVRGNHDNPMFFDGTHNFTNVIFMQDYDLVDVGDNRILGVGGATCVDRKPNLLIKMDGRRNRTWEGRREGIDWWPEEKFVYDEKKAGEIFGVNVVVTHTAPDFAFPNVWHGTAIYKWLAGDPELKEELPQEREAVTKLYNKLNEYNFINLWVYGHFHKQKRDFYHGTKFHLLDVNEFAEMKLNNSRFDDY